MKKLIFAFAVVSAMVLASCGSAEPTESTTDTTVVADTMSVDTTNVMPTDSAL